MMGLEPGMHATKITELTTRQSSQWLFEVEVTPENQPVTIGLGCVCMNE